MGPTRSRRTPSRAKRSPPLALFVASRVITTVSVGGIRVSLRKSQDKPPFTMGLSSCNPQFASQSVALKAQAEVFSWWLGRPPRMAKRGRPTFSKLGILEALGSPKSHPRAGVMRHPESDRFSTEAFHPFGELRQ